MSRFFKALEQAERDAAERRGEAAADTGQAVKEQSRPSAPAPSTVVDRSPAARSPEPPPAVSSSQASSRRSAIRARGSDSPL